MKKIKLLFSEEGKKDRQEILQALKELENLFIIKKDEFDPPLEEFNNLIAKCEDKIQIKTDSGENQSENIEKLDRIKQGRNDAKLTKDKRKWSYYYELLEKLYQKLNPPIPNGIELPETPDLKDIFYEEIVENLYAKLDQQKKVVESKGRYNKEKHEPREKKINKQIDDLQKSIEAIPNDTKKEVAYAKLQTIGRKKSNVESNIRDYDFDVR